MFAQDFAGTSGNLETDNNAVAFLQAATNTQRAIEEEEAPVEEVEKTDVIGDIELQDVVSAVQTQGAPATGQVTSQQLESIFPRDDLLIAAAKRREVPRG